MYVADDLSLKQIRRNCHRTAGDSFCNFGLESLGEALIAFAGDNGQNVYVLHILAEHIRIHTLAVLIDAKA